MPTARWVTIVLLLAGPVRAQNLPPYLRLLQRSERLARARFPARPALQLESLPLAALVETVDPGATAEAVERAGGVAGRAVGPVLPIAACPEVIESLARRPEVRRIEVTPPKRAVLDLSRPEVRADRVESGQDLPFPLDGRGVIAALVDTGVDYEHPDLGGARSRVLAIWDQAFATGEPPPGQTEGVLCDRDSIRKRQCTSIDVIGHGTHVTATMAGSGETFRGMAPKADILAVASIDFVLLVESVQWLFAEAEARGQPMVINLSLGGHYGPHDGTDLESAALSALTGPGRIIAASAGNEGSDFIHLGYDPDGSEGKTLFHVFSGFDVSVALFTIWFAADTDLEFAVGVGMAGEEVAETGFVAGDALPGHDDLQDGPIPLGRVFFEPSHVPHEGNGKLQLDIAVEPTDNAFEGNPQGYVWYLKVRGRGAFDAWSAAAGFLTPPARFSSRDDGGLVPGDNLKSVGQPAVAPGIIAVGSYATRASWIDDQGRQVDHAETTPGDISFFSSRGPSADPARTGPKPFIAAPGEYIVAALSKNSGALEEGTRIDDDHIAMRGTSMSCPHLAGVIALLLQVDPALDPDGIRAILAATARADAHTGPDLPDVTWGHGKVDAYEAVALALGVGICSGDADCTEGYACGDAGRCQAIVEEEGGCGCGGNPAPRPVALLVLLVWGLRDRDRSGSGRTKPDHDCDPDRRMLTS